MVIRIRILPIFIFVTSLMLMAKLGGIWYKVSNGDMLQQEGLAAGVVAQELTLPKANEESIEGVPKLRGEEQQVYNQQTLDLADDTLTPVKLQNSDTTDFGDPGNLSTGEIKLLYSLSDRRRKIIAREKKLIERESLLRAAEKQLDIKQEQLDEIKQDIEKLIARYDQRKEEENVKLRQIYSNMKPKSAAKIFNNLNTDTLIGILQDMQPRIVAPIVAEMNVEKAHLLTKELAERRAIDLLAVKRTEQ